MPATKLIRRAVLLAITTMIALVANLSAGTIPGNSFNQTNLVSNIPGEALTTDPDLVNPWGIALSSGSPFWISDNGTGKATLYNGSGVKQGLVVTVPPPSGGTPPSAPTGQIFNGNSSNFGGSHFIFDTEDGTVSAWSSGGAAALKVDNSGSGAVYKGLAMDSTGGNSYLYATNFHAGTVDVFNSSFTQVSVPGGFSDPTIPAGYAPFNIANIGGELFVTYALQDGAKHDDVAGPGNGFIDVFDANGNLLGRLVSNGDLNSPWGMAIAPVGFGKFAGDLLVGNFGDGTINAYNATSGAFEGTLDDENGDPIVDEGLWGLTFGNGGSGGATNTLYFTAGIPGPDPNASIEDNGLFGSIAYTPEPSSLLLLGTGFLGALLPWRKKR